VIAMGNWGASKKRDLIRKRGIECAKGDDRSSMVRRPFVERSPNAAPPKSKQALRAEAAAAFIAWREKSKAKEAPPCP
jgi:hypothetical protein